MTDINQAIINIFSITQTILSYLIWESLYCSSRNGCHLPDDILKCIILNENVWISIKISLKFVPWNPINNIPPLVHIMAWRRPGDKPLSETMMFNLLMHICVTWPQWVDMKKAPDKALALGILKLTFVLYCWCFLVSFTFCCLIFSFYLRKIGSMLGPCWDSCCSKIQITLWIPKGIIEHPIEDLNHDDMNWLALGRFGYNLRLIHWGLDKIAAISQTTFSSAFPWMKTFEFWMKIHCYVCFRV